MSAHQLGCGVPAPSIASTTKSRNGLYSRMAATLPVANLGETAEIADAYLYLMRQRYGTGQVLVVDGGGLLV